jgi:DNA-binding CsgD family transcriptional regulator
MDGLIDGILIVSRDGEWVYGNDMAYQICQELNLGLPVPGPIPHPIWQVCQVLLEPKKAGPNFVPLAEAEIQRSPSLRYRVRVRWLQLQEANQPYLLVTLEDIYQTVRCKALAEIQHYGLTARQSEVWLLYRTGFSYREIANQLFVTLNTVKRHMKDAYAKQKLCHIGSSQ